MNLTLTRTMTPRLMAAPILAGMFLLQCGAFATSPTPYAGLTVLVTRTNGSPITAASVCVVSGTTSRSSLTGAGGQAILDEIPAGQTTVTVSCPGFTGQSHTSTLPASGGTARFLLSEGSGGPVCTVTAPPPSRVPPTLATTSFDWHVNRRTPLFFEIAFSFAATRTPGGPVVPTHYRVGENSGLSGVQWIEYHGGVPLFQMGYRGNSLTAYGQRTLFLQLRQDDVTSSITSKTVDLQPVRTEEVRFDGSTLPELLGLIQEKGFQLAARTVSATQNHCAGIQLNDLKFSIPTGYLPDRAWEKIATVDLVESSSKRFTPGWHVKSIDIAVAPELPGDVAQTISGQSDGNGFRVTIHLSARPQNFGGDNPCFANSFPLRAITLEGPGDDMTLDQSKRWKNMFPPN